MFAAPVPPDVQSGACRVMRALGLDGPALDGDAMAKVRNTEVARGDWSSRSAESFLLAAQHGARLGQLHDQVMGCVARGQLAPDVLKGLLEERFAAQGAAWAARGAALWARFFEDLVAAATGLAAARDDNDKDNDNDHGDRPPPDVSRAAAPDTPDLAALFRRLEERGARRDTDAALAWAARLERVAAGDDAAADAKREVSRSRERRAAARQQRLARLYLELVDGWGDLAGGAAAGYLGDALALAVPRALAARERLELRGRVGASASTLLTIENAGAAAALFDCAVGDVRRADGVGPAFAAAFALRPPAMLLAPGQAASVELRVQLDGALFEPGPSYVGAVIVARDGAAREVPLQIVATGARRGRDDAPPRARRDAR
jgi:hypothetical protein